MLNLKNIAALQDTADPSDPWMNEMRRLWNWRVRLLSTEGLMCCLAYEIEDFLMAGRWRGV
jgi:hypothetical protein